MRMNIMAGEHRCNCGAGTLRHVVAAIACKLRDIYVCRACGALADVWNLQKEEENGSGKEQREEVFCTAV